MSSPVGTPPEYSWEMDTFREAEGSRSVVPSSENSQPGSGGGRGHDRKKRVGFTGDSGSNGRSPRRSVDGVKYEAATSLPTHAFDESDEVFGHTPTHSRSNSGEMPLPHNISRSHLPELTLQETQEIHEALARTPTVAKPRPAIRHTQSHSNQPFSDDDGETEIPFQDHERATRKAQMREAVERAKQLEHEQRSAPGSHETSPERRHRRRRRSRSPRDTRPRLEDEDAESDSDDDMPTLGSRGRARTYREADRLVRYHTRTKFGSDESASGFRSGAVTPIEEQNYANDYRPPPDHYRGGVIGSLMKLYARRDSDFGHRRGESSASLSSLLPRSRRNSTTATPRPSPPTSGTTTPKGQHWYSHMRSNRSAHSLSKLAGSSASVGLPVASGLGEQVSQRIKEQREKETRPGFAKSTSASAIHALGRIADQKRRFDEEQIKIKKHIEETIARQKYLMRLCHALMLYGAPTHRLEEYMRMSARVLEVDAQFLYIPGSMIISFDDESTHTTEVKLVRVTQGLDLGKLRDVHEVYKDVVHDRIGPHEAMRNLKEVTSRGPKYPRWIRILAYGIGAAAVGPFAFEARMIDLPIIFFLGCILGLLQLVIAPKSDLYANVFEVSAAVISSFLSRAFGSIWNGDKRLFCFSALAQASIALILPGYVVLTASLELQSKSIVAGSVRMVYAIIYSLFLGFGITIGTAIYGLMDGAATSETTCANPLPSKFNFLFVPIFALSLIVIHQAKWKQAPVMLVIAQVGYVVNFYSAQRFVGNTQVSNTLGALAIGVLANMYSRLAPTAENWAIDRWESGIRQRWKNFQKRVQQFRGRQNDSPKKMEEGGSGDDESVYEPQMRRVGYGLAAAAMLPAIFVQVPSGLSVNGSLVAGLASANQITGNSTNGTTVLNSTAIASNSGIETNSIAFTVSYSVIQVAIGITVGLFLSAIVVYPFGKKRSGLFSL